MKVFLSWSGEYSNKIAEVLNTWIPCIIQSTTAFFSQEDIEKGENWDARVKAELNECNYGIICLTHENVSAPWIHFEAGALAKALDSRVSVLMLNIKPSDIKGPLVRYQATAFEKQDVKKLIESINKHSESPLSEQQLIKTFEALWPSIEREITEINRTYIINGQPKKTEKAKEHIADNSVAIEEILQLLRRQNTILSNPDVLLPSEYIKYIIKNTSGLSNDCSNYEQLLATIIEYLNRLNDATQADAMQQNPGTLSILTYDFINSLIKTTSQIEDVEMKRYFINQLRRIKSKLKNDNDIEISVMRHNNIQKSAFENKQSMYV